MKLNFKTTNLFVFSIIISFMWLISSCSDGLFNTKSPNMKNAFSSDTQNTQDSQDSQNSQDQIKDDDISNRDDANIGENDDSLSGSCPWLTSTDDKYALSKIPNAPNFDPGENIKFLSELLPRISNYTLNANTYNVSFLTYQIYNSKVAPNDVGEWLTLPKYRPGVNNRANYIQRAYQLTINNAQSAQCEVKFTRTSNEFIDPGCFDENTLITMADGSVKAIKYIRSDDMVLNPVLNKAFKVKSVIAGPEEKALIRIGYGGMSVLVSYNHPFLTDKGLKIAQDLKADDLILSQDGGLVRIEILEVAPLQDNQVVWNIELEAESDDPMYHMVEANGVVAGDLFLQRQLVK